MARKQKGDLSHEDIKFLKAIQELENNPDEYPETNLTEQPANTSSLRAVLDMSRQQVTYRIRPAERGLEKMGLVRLYDSEVTESGESLPRSVELTDEGRKRITEWEEKYGPLDTQDWDATTVEEIERELDEIQSRLDELSGSAASVDGETPEAVTEEIAKLSSRIDAVSDQVSQFENSRYGAVDEPFGQRLDQSLDFVAGYHRIFEALGIPNPKEAHTESFDPEEARQQVRETLGVSGTEDGSVTPDSEEDDPFNL